MFKIHIGLTPCGLKENDYEELGKMTEGFSGSDISTAVNDALMEPVRTMQSATYFVKTQHTDSQYEYAWMPCSARTPNAVQMRLMEIDTSEQDKVLAPDLCMNDFRCVLRKLKPSVNEKDISRQMDWTKEFGQDG